MIAILMIECAKSLSEVLKSISTLTNLDLSSNNIGSEGCKYLDSIQH